MNSLKTIAASVTLALTAALPNQAVAQASSKVPKDIVSGVLIADTGAYQRCLIYGVKKGEVYYKANFRDVNMEKKRVAQFSGIFLFDPPSYKEAMNLYKDRKYKEAIPKFKECQENYKKFKEMENNFSDLSVFYELECLRKLHDYAAIEKRLELFISDKLTRPSHKAQLETYKLWSAVNTKNWARLQAMTNELRKKKVPIGIRAQIAFCEGLAHEGLEENSKALNAYAMAMTADFTKSDSIVRQAALNSLRIYAADESVQTAMKVWKTERENTNSKGYVKLGEANALARIYDNAGLGAGVELPKNYKKFQEFTSDVMIQRLKEKEEAANERAAAMEREQAAAEKAIAPAKKDPKAKKPAAKSKAKPKAKKGKKGK